MRITGDGIVPVATEVEITFDGEPVAAYEGESLAATLTAAGILALRRTKDGAGRGVFCGMGVCSECLVSIDGHQNIRACMTPVVAGMRVETQSSPGTIPEAPYPAPPAADETPLHDVEVLVVGGGPAGLAAAKAAALAGAAVTLIDERPALGGQYFKQLAGTHHFRDERAMDRQFRAGRDLIAEVEGLGVSVRRSAAVWSIFGPQEVGVLAAGETMVFRPSQLVLATGAYERGLPLPGWTLPGYMTTGAAQTLMRAYRVAPGRRVVVAGNGPLNFQVAAEMAAAGVVVVALLETARRPGPGMLGAALAALRHSPDLMGNGFGYLLKLARARVPVLYGHVIAEARGTDRVRSVTVAPVGMRGEPLPSPRRDFDVDAVCVGYGFIPSNDLSRPLGCRHRYDPAKGTLVVERNQDGETSVPGVFVAGDCGGMGGARAAFEQGFIAGCAAARNLGRSLPADLARERDRRRRNLISHERFQEALWTMFQAPRLSDQLAADDTLVCRCEGVSMGAVRRALADGTSSVGGLKRLTRGGMGRCQGRYCGPLLTQLVDSATGQPTGEFSYFSPRPPIKPVPIGALAREHALPTPPPTADSFDDPVGAAETPPGKQLKTDVAVIGGGVLGCSVAYYLARQGVDVVLAEKDDINTHASGRNAGTLHAQLQQSQARNTDPAWTRSFDETLPLYLEAGRTWQQLSQELDCDIELRFCGGLMVADTDEDLRFLERKVRRERARGLESTMLTRGELRDLAPYLTERLAGAEFCPHEGKLNPNRATPALARGAERAGARILRNAEVRALEATARGFEVATTRGRIHCKRVVNAAGPWAARIAAMVGVRFPVTPSPILSNVTEATRPFVKHMILHAHRRLSIKQTANGNVIVGGGWPGSQEPGMDQPAVMRISVEGNLGVATSVVPGMAKLNLLRTWTGFNLFIDGRPLLGEVPRVPGFFNAVTSTGYTLGPVCARLVAEQMTGRNLSYDIRPFSIERFSDA